MRWGNARTLEWARKVAIVEEGSFIPSEWEEDFCTSIGRDYEWHKKYTEKDMDKRITYRGASVRVCSSLPESFGLVSRRGKERG